MTRVAAVVSAALVAAVCAGTAHADPLRGDPRACAANTHGTRDHAAVCAAGAAHSTVSKWAATRHLPGTILCDRYHGSLLKWDCTIISGGDSTTVRVWFRALSSGWKRQVTVVS